MQINFSLLFSVAPFYWSWATTNSQNSISNKSILIIDLVTHWESRYICLTHFHIFCPSHRSLQFSLQGWEIKNVQPLKDETAHTLLHYNTHTQNSGINLTASCVFLGQCQPCYSERSALHLRDGLRPLVLRVNASQKGSGISLQVCTHHCVTWITPAASCQCQGHTGHINTHSDSRERGTKSDTRTHLWQISD